MVFKVITPVIQLNAEEIVEMQKYISRWTSPDTEIIIETLRYGFPSVESEAQGMFNGTEIVRKVYEVSKVYLSTALTTRCALI